MQPTSAEDENANGYIKHEENINGKQIKNKLNGLKEEQEEKVVLPVEMASMVPLRALIGKLVHKAHADLMTLTDTLPSMSDVEKKRQILTYSTFIRKQFLKLLALVKWAENAKDIQMCQNIMAFLANQNKIFQDTVEYLHKIHIELPAARLRNFDIPTAVDVLTTGTYQRMPTKIKDMLKPDPLSDEEVLNVFQDINDVIRMRMITTEVLPSPMKKYRIENGRIYFTIENEFEVALTLMGHSNDRRWWIVSLDIFIQATSNGGAAEDVDITLNDLQKQHLRVNAQKQLVPPFPPEEQQQDIAQQTTTNPQNSLFFPLVNMYDYLHLCCLNLQLETLYIQSALLAKTRWMNQLKIQMSQDRSKLTLVYWKGGSLASQWARPQLNSNASKSTTIDISIDSLEQQLHNNESTSISVRDEFKGLIQKAGIGASIALANVDNNDRVKVFSSLKYPKNVLQVLWNDNPELYTTAKLIDSANLNIEQLVLHVTHYHSQCIIEKFRKLLRSQRLFLEENGLHVAEDEVDNESQPIANDSNKSSSLVVRYRHQKYISIECDSRTGRIKAFDTSDGCSEADFKLRSLEDRLNNDPENIAQHLLWLRSEIVVREVISLAKQLNLQPYHPSQMNLRPEDISRLFDDHAVEGTSPAFSTSMTRVGNASVINNKYPSHCVFLQFSQFEDWYFVIATVKNEFKSWLCCLNKTYDQNGLYQALVDVTHIDCNQLWRDQFIGSPNIKNETVPHSNSNINKRSFDETFSKEKSSEVKRRKMSQQLDDSTAVETTHRIDRLSIDLRYLAKLDSLCRAYIINRKIETQLQSFKGSLSYHLRPLLQSLSSMEAQVMNHPAADKMEVVCVPQKDLLRTCAYHFADDGTKREKPLEINPWIEKMLPHMKHDVIVKPSGWWGCGRGDCYVVVQEKFDWKSLPFLEGSELGDHISLDKATSVLSFTYPNIDTCIESFLVDWERIFMMANLIRQVSSIWIKKYDNQLRFSPTDLTELSFTYAKSYVCKIKWGSSSKGNARQYKIELVLIEGQKKSKTPGLPTINSRNPHWRIASFLKDVLNDKRDLIYFIQILFQTLPLMTCLERLEMKCADEGDIGKISIIPRAFDSVRVIFSATNAIDIRFTDKGTICISDAAYHHLFYSSRSTSKSNDSFTAPQPFVIQSTQNVVTDNSFSLKPIKVAQQFKFVPFEKFSGLLDTLDNWIFNMNEEVETTEETAESSAIPFQHGLLCSASLCQGILYKLHGMV